MGQEPRKATEVLVDLESKIDVLLDTVRAQDLNIKVLSNKLNAVMEQLQKAPATPPQIRVEAVQSPLPNPFVQMPAGDPEKTIPIMAESKLPETAQPKGFRRNSRPETYAGDNAVLPHAEEGHRMPMQIPRPGPPPGRSPADVVVPAPPPKAAPQKATPPMAPSPPPAEKAAITRDDQKIIPVMQRVVDKNGKALFLAKVEVTDLQTNQPAFETKTNGTGKWMASLGIGAYRVVITKRESLTKDKLEAVQDISVDGSQSPLELPLMIIK